MGKPPVSERIQEVFLSAVRLNARSPAVYFLQGMALTGGCPSPVTA